MFTEMRTAALLQKVSNGPETLRAAQALRMATIEGAKALGLGNVIGSIEAGKRADVMVVRLDDLHLAPYPDDPVSSIVYAAQPADVQSVIIDGRIVMRSRRLLTLDERQVRDDGNREAGALRVRAGV